MDMCWAATLALAPRRASHAFAGNFHAGFRADVTSLADKKIFLKIVFCRIRDFLMLVMCLESRLDLFGVG